MCIVFLFGVYPRVVPSFKSQAPAHIKTWTLDFFFKKYSMRVFLPLLEVKFCYGATHSPPHPTTHTYTPNHPHSTLAGLVPTSSTSRKTPKCKAVQRMHLLARLRAAYCQAGTLPSCMQDIAPPNPPSRRKLLQSTSIWPQPGPARTVLRHGGGTNPATNPASD